MFLRCLVVFAAAQAAQAAGVITDYSFLPDQLTNILMEEMVDLYHAKRPWLRTAHQKQHGCLRAVLTVNEDIPADLKVGLFSNATQYPMFMRYSNGAGPAFGPSQYNESDLVLDGRGLALKVFGKEREFGPTYLPAENFIDFTFALAPTFFLDSPNNTLEFFQALQSGYPAMKVFFQRYPWLAYQFNTATRRIISDALQENWYTPPARMHGDAPAKYRLSPCSGPQRSPASACQSFDCIKEKLQERLNGNSGCYLWQVQRYESEDTTPIDDLTRKWNTTFTTLGKVEVLATKNSWNAPQDAFCRHMSFNDWRVIAEHEPLGFVEHIRKEMYLQGSLMRHALAGQTQKLATIDDWDNYETMM